jgi:hypothetical protein
MVDLKVLEKKGISVDGLRKKLTSTNPSEDLAALKRLIPNRLKTGLNKSWAEARVYRAIDDAFDAPLDQTKWYFIQNLSQKKLNAESLTRELMDYGLEHMLKQVCSGCLSTSSTCSSGCTVMGKSRKWIVDLPLFLDVVVGLIPAYVKMRWAKLYNDRDQQPFYKYDPIKLTLKAKVKSDILTDRVSMMANQYGYKADRKQRILQMLLYGISLQMPVEEWHKEMQILTVYDKDGKNPKEEEYLIREGLRYHYPHANKSWVDDAYRLSTINTDTGCGFAGHWYLTTFGNVNRNKAYFNKDKLKYTSSDWVSSLDRWAQYYPCSLRWPEQGTLFSPNDREVKAQFYGDRGMDKDEDLTLVSADSWDKLVPSQWGLGDYDYPVWFRSVIAAQDTFVYMAPVPYCPVSAYLYDFDNNRARNPTMVTEVAPFQSIISNYFTQMLYSVQQNLMRVTFFNEDIVKADLVEKLKGLTESRLFRGNNFVPFSGRKNAFDQRNVEQAFASPSFPQHNVSEIIQCISTAINVLERVLQFSSQELGVAASHEQSAAETHIIAGNADDRRQFTASFIDDGENSDKRRIYEGLMAYGSDDIFAQIAELNDVTRAALKSMGWTVEEEAVPGHTQAGIKGNKNTLRLENFADTREGRDRVNNAQVGATMVQLVQLIVTNPIILQSLGMPQIVSMFNEIFAFVGVPTDFRLHVTNPNAIEEVKAEQQQQARQAQPQQPDMAQLAQQVAQIAAKISSEQIAQFAKVLGEKFIQPITQGLKMLLQREMATEQHQAMQDKALHDIMDKISMLAGGPTVEQQQMLALQQQGMIPGPQQQQEPPPEAMMAQQPQAEPAFA